MKKVLIICVPTIFVSLFGVMLVSCQKQPDINCLHQFGTGSGDYIADLATDTFGDLYVVGSTYGSLPNQTSAGSLDAFIRKYDSLGSELWTRQFGTDAVEVAESVAAGEAGNVYMVGYTDKALPGQTDLGGIDAYIRKYDDLGNDLWTRQFGTDRDEHAWGVAVDGAGNVYVAGDTKGAFPDQINLGGYDSFLRKYDSSGKELWTIQFGGADQNQPKDIAVDSTGGIYISGEREGGGAFGFHNAFISKYDSSGTELWTHQFGTGEADFITAVAIDILDNVYVTGSTFGSFPEQTNLGDLDAFLRKYDSWGNEMWTHQFGTEATDQTYGVAVGPTGSVYVVGNTMGTLPHQEQAGGGDAFLCKYDSSGNEQWTKQFGTSAPDLAKAVAIGYGIVYIGGNTNGSLPCKTSSGPPSAFIAEAIVDEESIAPLPDEEAEEKEEKVIPTPTSPPTDLSTSGAETVEFADKMLDLAIGLHLKKAMDEEITVEELAKISSLDASERNITDLSGIEYCTNLTSLNLVGNPIVDFSPLSSLINLNTLQLGYFQISDVSQLSSLTGLTSLHLVSSQIGDISPLASLTELRTLGLGKNRISDISPLTSLTSLITLDLGVNQISDISPLTSLTNLNELWLGENQISDVSPLSSLTKLTRLFLYYNQISDISPLASLTNLRMLGLSDNLISDISPLASLANLAELNLGRNQISDISPLASLTNLTKLYLRDNQISDISPLMQNSGIGSGDHVYLGVNQLDLSEGSEDLSNIKKLEARGVNVHY